MIDIEYPVLIYDDTCSSCTKYAKWVDKFLGGKITTLGHYTRDGVQFKKDIHICAFDDVYKMSWFVSKTHAYGGRKGLIKLLAYMWSKKPDGPFPINEFLEGRCHKNCRTMKMTLFSSCSILTTGEIIEIDNNIPI